MLCDEGRLGMRATAKAIGGISDHHLQRVLDEYGFNRSRLEMCDADGNQLGSEAWWALCRDEVNPFDSSVDNLQQTNVKLVVEITRLELEFAVEKHKNEELARELRDVERTNADNNEKRQRAEALLEKERRQLAIARRRIDSRGSTRGRLIISGGKFGHSRQS
jgi:chromosome segregation ATPase